MDDILHALQNANRRTKPPRRPSTWRTSLAVVPGIGVALLPKVACPACWPAYAGVLSAVGMGFLLDEKWLLPLSGTFLVLAVAALAFRAPTRRGYGPFLLGTAASGAALVSKFVLDSNAAMYAGLAVLVIASVWNSWPRRQDTRCVACPPERITT